MTFPLKSVTQKTLVMTINMNPLEFSPRDFFLRWYAHTELLYNQVKDESLHRITEGKANEKNAD